MTEHQEGYREGKETYRGINHYITRVGEAGAKVADLAEGTARATLTAAATEGIVKGIAGTQ